MEHPCPEQKPVGFPDQLWHTFKEAQTDRSTTAAVPVRDLGPYLKATYAACEILNLFEFATSIVVRETELHRIFIAVDLPGLHPYPCQLYTPSDDVESEALSLFSNLQDWANDNLAYRLPRCPLPGHEDIVGLAVMREGDPARHSFWRACSATGKAIDLVA
jgi:hypothetical protein